MTELERFEPPPYPYARLADARRVAEELPGGMVDLSVGTPLDPPSEAVVATLAATDRARVYPPSVGTSELRAAAARWMSGRFGVDIEIEQIAASVGSKEFVAGLPGALWLHDPTRDTVLYPAVSYPSYAMGARLARMRAVPVPMTPDWRIDLAAVDPADIERAAVLWVNIPGNPAGGLDDLGEVARWGREHGVLVASDECYAEFTWDGSPRSILEHGTEGVLAVHSVSKRSNLAGARIGFYAGDAELVEFLASVRQHAGMMPAGPCQAAAVVALDDQAGADAQVERYRDRLALMTRVLTDAGLEVGAPGGAFYLWVPSPDGDDWALVDHLARKGGAVVAPGEFYGPDGQGHVRVAVVQGDDRLELVAERLGV